MVRQAEVARYAKKVTLYSPLYLFLLQFLFFIIFFKSFLPFYFLFQSNYEYKYEVSDHQTGDRKSHWETREGDKVRGAYTVYEPDGALRRVEYSADAVQGYAKLSNS